MHTNFHNCQLLKGSFPLRAKLLNFRTIVTDEIPPFSRNDSPIGGLRDEEAAAKPPLPHPLSKKEDRHSDQREESSAHISNFTERHKQ
ncbi:hypothetical protein [Viscerimonas tarda]